ncbi:hypothetical protein CsSME_00017574 [Camellia sinensis var. sinensis]
MPAGLLPLTPDEDGDLDFEPGIYISVAVGFVVGLGSFIGALALLGHCVKDQKSLLLQLKNNLKFNFSVPVRFVNWTQSNNCCDWKRVTCNQGGHVTGLDLNSESIPSSLPLLPFYFVDGQHCFARNGSRFSNE